MTISEIICTITVFGDIRSNTVVKLVIKVNMTVLNNFSRVGYQLIQSDLCEIVISSFSVFRMWGEEYYNIHCMLNYREHFSSASKGEAICISCVDIHFWNKYTTICNEKGHRFLTYRKRDILKCSKNILKYQVMGCTTYMSRYSQYVSVCLGNEWASF